MKGQSKQELVNAMQKAWPTATSNEEYKSQYKHFLIGRGKGHTKPVTKLNHHMMFIMSCDKISHDQWHNQMFPKYPSLTL